MHCYSENCSEFNKGATNNCDEFREPFDCEDVTLIPKAVIEKSRISNRNIIVYLPSARC